MNNSLFFFFYLTILIGISNCQSYNSKDVNTLEKTTKPMIEFSKSVLDFGLLSYDTLVTDTCYIFNRSNEKLLIKEIQTECNCTSCKINNEIIFPNDSIPLVVYFSSKNLGFGAQRKAIYIRSNATNEYSTILLKYRIKEN